MNKALSIGVALGAGVLVISGLGLIKYLQIQAMIAQYANWSMPPSAVSSQVVQEEEWADTINAVGSIAAVQGVMVSTDQAGIVEKINFESGQSVKKGDILVQLDVSQELAQLRSAAAQVQLSKTNLTRQDNLLKNKVSAQADFDSAQAQFDQADARVQEVKALVEKKTIRAPFDGVIGIRLVNLGQYLESGAQVAPLQSLDPIYVNFWVPQQHMGRVAPGQEVIVTAEGFDKPFTGKVNAVDTLVNEATRNVQIQATLPNTESKLRPGMFVNVTVPLAQKTKYVVLPATAVQFAPYGDSDFIVEKMKDEKQKEYLGVRQQVVKIGESRGDRVGILEGVKPGEEVVTTGVFKLNQGAHVQINNSIQPGNSEKPNPEDS